MKRFFCLFSVFLALFSQMLFLGESNVIYSNILSLFVVPSFILTIYGRRIDFSHQIKTIFFLLIYFLVSYIWSDAQSFIELNHYKILILTLIFLICIHNILIKHKTILPVMIAFWAITVFNFLILIDIIPQNLFFELEYWDLRFYGTFNNPNIGAISFSFALFFADYFLLKYRLNSKLLKLLLILIMIFSFVLVVVTASKKGILLLSLFFIYKVFKLKKSSFKNVLLVLLVFVISVQYIDLTLIDKVFDFSFARVDKFINDTRTGSVEDGSTQERLFYIKEGLTGFFDSPLIGHGFRSFKAKYGEYSHNNFLELLYNGGLIIFIIYYLMYFKLYKQSLIHNIGAVKLITIFSIMSFLMIDLAAVTYLNKTIQYVICTLYVLNYNEN